MRRRPLLLAVTASVGLILVASAYRGTPVRVVDARGAAVPGVRVQVIYPSFGGPSTITDDQGCTRLPDTWWDSPLFHLTPEWVWVVTAVGRWEFDYPPPELLRLDPARGRPF